MQAKHNDVDSTIGELLGSLKVYKRIGTDTDGRTHHYDREAHQIVICRPDRVGGIADEDVLERVGIPEWSEHAADYVAYVREETDTEWASVDIDESAGR